MRHKALDLIGDMALVGQPLLARIVAHKAGHALHTQLVTRLLADHSLWKETTEERAPAIRYEREPRSRRFRRRGGLSTNA